MWRTMKYLFPHIHSTEHVDLASSTKLKNETNKRIETDWGMVSADENSHRPNIYALLYYLTREGGYDRCLWVVSMSFSLGKKRQGLLL